MKLTLPAGIDLHALRDDFRNLNPNDVGTWPLLPRLAVLAAVMVLVVVLGWYLVWNGQLEDLAAKQHEEGTLKEQYLDKKRQAINLDLYKQQLDEIDRSFGSLLKQLPSRSEVESLLVEVNQSGLGRGLQFELFKPEPEIVKDFYAELPISLRLVGAYHDFGAFSGDVGKLSRIVTLGNMAISTGKDGAMVFDATARTYRYLDEEEMAAQRKAAAAAKKGARK